jgi:hypothetical protein
MDGHPFHNAVIQRAILFEGSQEDVIKWLVWNDRNGTYTDADSKAEGMPPLTLPAARQHMADILARR